MKKLSILFILTLTFLPMFVYGQSQPVSYFGAIPDLKVNGKEFVDPTGKAVTLHGVMDTPSAYFNGGRWTNGEKWADYNNIQNVDLAKKYFTKIFQAIANPAKGTYCNLFRLHLDPCWATCDANVKATGFTEKDNKVYDPHDNEVSGEANIYHFDMTRFKARMADLYVPIIQDALAHGLYVVVRPPGVFPHDIWVGDYYNTFLTNIWDEISKNDYIRSHSGQIMLELGNEPVRIWKNGEIIPTVPAANKTLESTRSDAYNGYSENNPVLADFFQPIVNKIRQNGFDGIILLPGTSYQANYASYSNKAISDSKNNYGYAVHNYPGWYGGWDKNQTEAQFISTFENQVPIDQKPIVITEVDWSPEWRLSDKSHWNEEHTQFTAGNYGTWATGTTNGVTQGVDLVASQNIGWGLKYRHLVDKHPNISFTLQGTTTYVDMDAYLKDGTVQPAFLTQMKKDGYPDARQACSGYCFDWYKDFACGNRIPYGTPNVAPERIEYHSAISGSARYDESNQHYIFPTTYSCAFIVNRYEGTKLSEAGKLMIKLGEGTVGYRLDVQLKNGNAIIKDGNDDYIIGNETKGTRLPNFEDAKYAEYDLQTIFADYLSQYPDCTIGSIRINTATPQNNETAYWFTIDKMEMTYKKTFPIGVNQYYDQTDGKYYFFEPYGCAFEFDNFVGKKAMLCDELTVYCDRSQSTVGYRLDIFVTDPSGATITTHYKQTWGDDATAENVVIGENDKGTRLTEAVGNVTFNVQEILRDVLLEHPNAVIGKIRLNTVVSTSDANREGLYYIKLNGLSMTDAPANRVTVSKEKITEEVKDLSEFKMYNYDNSTPREITDTYIRYNQELSGGQEVFGINGNVYYKEYSDLTGYTQMKIYGSGPGKLRIMFNRISDQGQLIEIDKNLTDGVATIDLSSYDHVYLHSIKLAYEGNVTVSRIELSKPIENAPSDFDADYYFYGSGSLKGEANFALQDKSATVIDLQGMTNTEKINSIQTANPNCLLIYNDDEKVNAYGGNFVKNNSWGYSAWRINLVDGFDFYSPVNIGTAAQNYDSANPYGASYTRDLGTTKTWGTTVIPFALDVTAEGSPGIYVLNSQDGDILHFTKVTKETLPAGSIILYYQENGGIVKLLGEDIAQTVEGFNILPVADVNGWYTAQSYKSQVIEDVTTDPYLKDYDVYAVSNNKFVHATKKLTLNPFRALYLHKKAVGGAPKASFNICLEDVATGIQENLNLSETREVEVYDVMGRRVSTPVKGITIIRMPNGTVRKVLNK